MIGLLIIAHGNLGESLIQCASHVLGKKPDHLDSLAVNCDDDPSELLPKAQAMIAALDSGQGVLVLSDIYGATPCNMVVKLLEAETVEGIAGVNLPMLVRVLTYRQETLQVCIKKAISGGREGVVSFNKRGCNHENQTIT